MNMMRTEHCYVVRDESVLNGEPGDKRNADSDSGDCGDVAAWVRSGGDTR